MQPKDFTTRYTTWFADDDAYATQTLRGLIRASTTVIEANRNVLNALNVFPVPDGDTGTNMLLTLRNIEEQLDAHPASTFAETVNSMARAALLGARGNSGLILAQLFRGMRVGLQDATSITGTNFAASLAAATELAYKAVPQPREGTMLTVIRESAAAATHAANELPDDDSLALVVERAADEAMQSVERTPELLEVLKQAGVIDSGGWGLAMMFESMYRYLNGEGEVTIVLDPPATNITANTDFSRTGITIDQSFVDSIEEEEWGYCTVFAVEGSNLDLEQIRADMDGIGSSPVIAGDDTLVKVHLHTEDPGQALTAGVRHGALSNIDINNMDVQAAEWSADRLSDADAAGAPPTAIEIGVLAVVQGDGMVAYFHGVAPGAVSIVEGGDTLNPSVEELLSGLDAVPSDTVIVLPNNKNVIGAAQQAANLTDKTAQVIPTTTMQEGIAAIGAFDPDADIQDNVAEMSDMLNDLHVGDVFMSQRDAQYGDVEVKQGEYMVRVDGTPVGASNDEVDLLVKGVCSTMHHGASVYIFTGADQDQRRASEAIKRLRQATTQYNRVEVKLIDAGQPNYNFLFSIE